MKFQLLSPCVLALTAAFLPAQATWYVAANATPPGNGSQSSPFTTIQAAVAAASILDTVLVAPGLYGSFNFAGKALTVSSSAGPSSTMVDAGFVRSAVEMIGIQGGTAVLDGFTLTNGQGSPFGQAGGVTAQSSSVTIRDCIVLGNRGNSSTIGLPGGTGGIFLDNVTALVEGCRIENNMGGMGGFGATMTAGRGGTGGIEVGFGTVATIRDCLIVGNIGGVGGLGGIVCVPCTGLPGGMGGTGGVFLQDGPSVVTRCIIRGNSGGVGGPSSLGGPPGLGGPGAMRLGNLNALTSSVVAFNLPGPAGGPGGILIENDNVAPNTPPGITNVTIAFNTFGAIVNAGAPNVPPTVANSIVWMNGAFEILALFGTQLPNLTHCDVFGGYPGTGNLSSDPFFADAAANDWHLRAGSPCIDAGSAAAPLLPLTDFEGEPRIQHGTPDIGADESGLLITLAQLPGSGAVFVLNDNLLAGHDCLNVFSLEPCPGDPGSGPLGGLCATTPAALQFLITQVSLPAGSLPFHFIASTSFTFFGPFSLPPLTLEAVCVDLTDSRVSRVARLVIQ